MADRATHPRRLLWVLGIFAISLASFVILRFVGEAILDHDQPWMPGR
jgi:hypothetical protein